MTKERIYYIAYEVCNYMRKREMQNQFEDYEFCMYVAELAEAIEYAAKSSDGKFLEQYYEVLNDELENLVGMEDCFVKEVKELIDLLDEWESH
jgi:hypothetical protein